MTDPVYQHILAESRRFQRQCVGASKPATRSELVCLLVCVATAEVLLSDSDERDVSSLSASFGWSAICDAWARLGQADIAALMGPFSSEVEDPQARLQSLEALRSLLGGTKVDKEARRNGAGASASTGLTGLWQRLHTCLFAKSGEVRDAPRYDQQADNGEDQPSGLP